MSPRDQADAFAVTAKLASGQRSRAGDTRHDTGLACERRPFDSMDMDMEMIRRANHVLARAFLLALSCSFVVHQQAVRFRQSGFDIDGRCQAK